jgi:hypothetical protein
MNNEVKFDSSSMIWIQTAQNKQGIIKGSRSVSLPLLDDGDSLYAAVGSFAEFVSESGGDIKTSVQVAMDGLQQAAANWMTKVDKGASETDIKSAGSQLKRVIELYKALESYYLTEYEYQRTGTGGD